MSTVLVTGGAGFIGSHLALHLNEMGHKVVVLDDLSGGFMRNLGEPISTNFYRGSICDKDLVDQLFAKYQFEYVYHIAAYATEGLSHFIKRFNYNNNLIGSVNLINAAVNHGCKCFVFTSSMAVYGAGQTPFSESMVPMPEDSYGVSKYAVELELKVTKDMFGMDYVIFRPHNVIGEKQNLWDRYRNVAGIFMNQLLKNEPMTIFGDGEQTRAFSYVGDIVPIIANSPTVREAIGQTFNIGGESPYTINKLSHMVADAMAREHKVVHLPPRHEVKHAYCDHSKLYSVFGKQKLTPIPLALVRMAGWAEREPSRPRLHINEISQDGLEIEKNLPSFWRE